MLFVIFLLCLPTLVHPQLNSGVSKYYVKPTKLECNFDPKWLVNTSCKLKPVSWEKTLMNLKVDITRPLKNVMGHMQLFRHEARFIPFLVNITTDACDILSNKGIQFYTRLVLKLLKKFATMDFVTCPMHGHVEMKNAYFEEKYANLLLTGLYRIELSAMEQSEPILHVAVQVLGVSTYDYYIKPTKLECYFNPKWFGNGSCTLKAINWEKTVVNIRVDIKQPLSNVVARFEVFRFENRFVPFLVNISVNVCDILSNKGLSFYTRIALGVLKRFGTIEFETCPLHGHAEVRDAYLDSKYTRNLIPMGLYRMEVTGTKGSETLGRGAVHALVEKHLQKFNKSRGL